MRASPRLLLPASDARTLATCSGGFASCLLALTVLHAPQPVQVRTSTSRTAYAVDVTDRVLIVDNVLFQRAAEAAPEGEVEAHA